MTAAQAFATRNVAAGKAINVAGATNQYGTTGVYTIKLDSGTTPDAELLSYFSVVPPTGSTTVPAKDHFIAAGGDAYFTPNDIKGTDEIYLYITSEGAVMGSVYANGGVVKGVAGVSPDAAVTEFNTATMRGGTIAVTGEITLP